MWQHLKTDGHVRKLATLILIARHAFPVIQVAISSYVQVMDVTNSERLGSSTQSKIVIGYRWLVGKQQPE